MACQTTVETVFRLWTRSPSKQYNMLDQVLFHFKLCTIDETVSQISCSEVKSGGINGVNYQQV